MNTLEKCVSMSIAKIDEAMSRHEKAVLAFSGGKDSLACLRLLYPYRDRLTVATVDTGAIFPHMVKFIEEATKDFKLKVIRTDQAAYWRKHGVPSRIVPIYNHAYLGFMEEAHGERILVNDWLSCHQALVNNPLNDYIQSSDASLFIMGQREDEGYQKLPNTAGRLELLTPINDWTAPVVFDYLKSIGISLPAQYSELSSSLDCWNCPSHTTAQTVRFVQREYPERVQELQACMFAAYSTVADALTRELPALKQLGLLDLLAARLKT